VTGARSPIARPLAREICDDRITDRLRIAGDCAENSTLFALRVVELDRNVIWLELVNSAACITHRSARKLSLDDGYALHARSLEQWSSICGTYGEWLQLGVVDKVQLAILHKLDRHGVFVQLGACHERIEGLETGMRVSVLRSIEYKVIKLKGQAIAQ